MTVTLLKLYEKSNVAPLYNVMIKNKESQWKRTSYWTWLRISYSSLCQNVVTHVIHFDQDVYATVFRWIKNELQAWQLYLTMHPWIHDVTVAKNAWNEHVGVPDRVLSRSCKPDSRVHIWRFSSSENYLELVTCHNCMQAARLQFLNKD